MDAGDTIETLRTAARALTSHAQPADCLRAIQSAQDALDAVKAAQLAALEECRGFEDEGASSVKTWVRNNLRLDPSETTTLLAAGSTLKDLPVVADAAGRGEIRLGHVKSLTYGIRHIGRDIMTDSQDWLVDVARTHEPAELHQVIRALREAVFPDSLDQAWADGMARQDITINPVPDGCSAAAMPCLRRLHSHRFSERRDGCEARRGAALRLSATLRRR